MIKLDDLSEDGFVDKYYNLFPAKIKSGGYYIRTGKSDVKKKLKKFNEEFPEYTRSIIITATINYLEERKKSGYTYCKLAPYFIYKDGMSILEGFCEAVLQGVKQDSAENKEESSNKTQLGATDF